MTINERLQIIDNLGQMWTAFAGIANPYCDAKAIMQFVEAKDRIHSILAEDGKEEEGKDLPELDLDLSRPLPRPTERRSKMKKARIVTEDFRGAAFDLCHKCGGRLGFSATDFIDEEVEEFTSFDQDCICQRHCGIEK